jgi:hypothetical protein
MAMKSGKGGKRSLFSSKRYRKVKDLVSRKINDEVILVPIMEKADGLNAIYSLRTSVELKIWGLITPKNTVGDIIAAIEKQFKAKPSVVKADVVEFLRQLRDEGLIVEC